LNKPALSLQYSAHKAPCLIGIEACGETPTGRLKFKALGTVCSFMPRRVGSDYALALLLPMEYLAWDIRAMDIGVIQTLAQIHNLGHDVARR
jgi:hypothetical protein